MVPKLVLKCLNEYVSCCSGVRSGRISDRRRRCARNTRRPFFVLELCGGFYEGGEEFFVLACKSADDAVGVLCKVLFPEGRRDALE